MGPFLLEALMTFTPKSTPKPLNQGQIEAAEGFFTFLFSDDLMFNLMGPAGHGKTFLMSHLIDEVMPRYLDTCALMGIKPVYTDVVMTATTNQAAEVLHQATGRETETIQSFMNLTVKEDFVTGDSRLIPTRSWMVHRNKIIFVDEASTIDSVLLEYLKTGTEDCKIVFVSDNCQLGPIKETISPIYQLPIQKFELTQPMRNAGSADLMQLCNQLRNTVKTGNFYHIKLVKGVIDNLDNTEMEQAIHDLFVANKTDSRIVAYSNPAVIDYNNYIRGERQLPMLICAGETLVSNSAIQTKSYRLSIQEEVNVLSVDPQLQMHTICAANNIELEVQMLTLRTLSGVFSIAVPTNWDYCARLLKWFAKQKNWERYYFLKKTYPDLRPKDASTVHKIQGSTCDTVLIDAGNLSSCHNPLVAARLLYVAASRARSRVIFYGDLAEKYGGFIQ